MSLSDAQLSILEFRRQLYRPTPQMSVVEWCERNLSIRSGASESPGPLSTSNRPYTREPLEGFKDPTVTEITLCWGSQTSKTTTIMGGMAWMIRNEPRNALWLLPNKDLAISFSKGRWKPFLADSADMQAIMPADEDDYTNLEQQFIGCALAFVGSNSPANLASRPCGILAADEVDKFAEATEKEADALNLAEQRLKAFSSSKQINTSTPTTMTGPIWRKWLEGDQRRFLIPCPHCKQGIKLTWAQVRWDEAKDSDGAWDMKAVRASARYECQLCGGRISDGQKVASLRHGKWVAENPNAMPGHRSYHLSSLYSPDRKCTWGALAVKFLKAKESLDGLQGFVNGDLAEPYEGQNAPSRREEIIVVSEPGDGGARFLTVDHQAKAPFFWFKVRLWADDGSTTGLDAGPLDTWDKVRAKQIEHSVQDNHVLIDSGYDAQTVYQECLRWGRFVSRPAKIPLWVGWMPAKGMPRRGWRNADQVETPWNLLGVNPSQDRGARMQLNLLEFSADTIKDLLASMRRGEAGIRWAVLEKAATPEYWRQMDAEHKVGELNRRTGRMSYNWRPRHKDWPNHIFDCEVMQTAAAMFHKRLRISNAH